MTSVGRLPVTKVALRRIAAMKYGDPPPGWGPSIRRRYGYFTPDDVYEAVVDQVVTPGCRWLDVGCGRDVFPNNRPLARELATRCGELVGVDPDATINENPFVHQRVQATLDDFTADLPFDVVTMRMVVEHVGNPPAFVDALRRLVRPAGTVVIYTVNKWSAVSFASWIVPFALHHRIKSVLWGTEEEDTFPVEYRMNTRGALDRLMTDAGFHETHFSYVDDCRTFARFRLAARIELATWRSLHLIGLPYPETCLLGVYRRQDA